MSKVIRSRIGPFHLKKQKNKQTKHQQQTNPPKKSDWYIGFICDFLKFYIWKMNCPLPSLPFFSPPFPVLKYSGHIQSLAQKCCLLEIWSRQFFANYPISLIVNFRLMTAWNGQVKCTTYVEKLTSVMHESPWVCIFNRSVVTFILFEC